VSFETPPAVHLALLAVSARLPFAQGSNLANSARSSGGRRARKSRSSAKKSTLWSRRRLASGRRP
jgi:hypothetical protein